MHTDVLKIPNPFICQVGFGIVGDRKYLYYWYYCGCESLERFRFLGVD